MVWEQCFLPNKSSKLVPHFVRPLLATKLTEKRQGQVRARAHLSPLSSRSQTWEWCTETFYCCRPLTVHWAGRDDQGHSLTRPTHHREPVHTAPSPGRQSLNANKTLRTFVSKSNLFYRMADKSLVEAGWTGGFPIPGPCQRRIIQTRTSLTPATLTWSCSSGSFSTMTWHWPLKTVGCDTLGSEYKTHLCLGRSEAPITLSSYIWCKQHRAYVGEFLNS